MAVRAVPSANVRTLASAEVAGVMDRSPSSSVPFSHMAPTRQLKITHMGITRA